MEKMKLHPVVENLNNIMKDKGLSKIEFANLCEFPEPKWNKISNGKQELSLWELSKIASSLKMPVQDIITYPDKYVKLEDGNTGERVSITFEVSPDKRDMLLRLVTQKE